MLGRRAFFVCAIVGLYACGGRSEPIIPPAADKISVFEERCNQLDDDGDGRIDEGFRDALGNYVDSANCGSCGHACSDTLPNALGADCELIESRPYCTATACKQGFGRSRAGQCVPLDDHLCLPCSADGDCGSLAGARCLGIGEDNRCTRPCADRCPSGYVCFAGDHCEPEHGSCNCLAQSGDFTLACVVSADNQSCPGRASCKNGQQSDCAAPAELCDGIDNDCDGVIDNGFLDARGVYSLSPANCGACGKSCSVDSAHGASLACGGDPFAPSCVSDCPDAHDGIQVGDHLDADRKLDNGCECVVRSLNDQSGALSGDELDANCDGADGQVLASFYVTVEGDDSAPGSPTRPLRSIGVAAQRAFDSLGSASPRPHVYIASGIYTESVLVRDGVSLHGGYRSDFLSRNPNGFPVVIAAPADTQAFGGAALIVDRAGQSTSAIEGLELRGRDADAGGAPAIGMQLINPGPLLTLRALHVRSGKAGSGQSGPRGPAGADSSSIGADGAMPQAALEDGSHMCIASDGNRTRGGAGGRNSCNGIDVSGGNGASAVCPHFATQAANGRPGHARELGAQGAQGHGGVDLSGPITNDPACSTTVCCGLADFSVPPQFVQATAGGQGGNGGSGGAGQACSDGLGSFVTGEERFIPGAAGAGSDGDAGGGGGGGGAGSGVEMSWIANDCEFADGLGGAGGGGGAGGCGGTGGVAGQSGGPSIGILIQARDPLGFPSLKDLLIETQAGAPGGGGGAGGDGAPGASGGFGGRVPDALRSTPSLAGPMQGERGGRGGDGGAGGGGGGGCGGASVGIWLYGLGSQDALASTLLAANQFTLGAGGAPGRGGGGAVPAAAGAQGLVFDVLAK